MGYSTCATHYLMRGLHGYLPLSVTASPTPENLAELTFIIALEKPAWYVTFADFELHSPGRNLFCRREVQIWKFGQKDSSRPAPSHKKKSLPAQRDTALRFHKQNNHFVSFGASQPDLLFFAASSAVTGGSQRKLVRKCQHRFSSICTSDLYRSSRLWLLSYLCRKP